MPEMEQIGADIQDYQTQLQTNIQTKGADFQKQVQAYQQAAPTMTEEARAAKEAELQKKFRETFKSMSRMLRYPISVNWANCSSQYRLK